MIEQLVEGLNLDYKKSAKGWLQMPCPLAKWRHENGSDRRPSFGINIDTGMCNCFSCGFKAPFPHLFKILAERSGDIQIETAYQEFQSNGSYLMMLLNSERTDKQEEKELELFPIAMVDHWPNVLDTTAGKFYLENERKMDLRACQNWDLRYDIENARVAYLVKHSEEYMYGAVGRNLTGPAPYYNYFEIPTRRVLGGYYELNNPQAIGVVEGYFDMVNSNHIAKKYGIQMVCTFSKNFSDTQAEMLLELDLPIFNFYDNDKAGKEGEEAMAEKLKGFTYKYNNVKWKSKKDLGEMNRKELETLFKGLI